MTENQKAIVTLKLFETNEEIDVELPVFLPAASLKYKLVQLLSYYRPEIYGNINEISLRFGKKLLSDRDTLASAGIWDGSIVKLERSGG